MPSIFKSLKADLGLPVHPSVHVSDLTPELHRDEAREPRRHLLMTSRLKHPRHEVRKRTMPKASSRRGGTLTRPDAVAGISAQERNNPDKTSPKFQQQFAFVKGLTSKTERKKTRSWVTTQHYRKKRFEEGQVKEEGDLEPKRKGRRCSKPSSRSRSTRSNENPLTQAKDERLSQPSLGAVGFDKSSFLERLGSGRSDPFNSYPVVATRDVHELVDHCASTYTYV